MKVGLILECGPMGADKQVCEHLIGRLDPALEFESVTLDNKPNMIEKCGAIARELLSGGCDHIAIVWDLYPAWRVHREPPCRFDDRQSILQSLLDADVPVEKVSLICIDEELEAWLICDERALSSVLSTAAHPVAVRRNNRAYSTRKPKTALNRLFQQSTGRPYQDLIHAIGIIRAVPDFQRLRRCESFSRFALKVTLKNI
jgi:hypothetical protein